MTLFAIYLISYNYFEIKPSYVRFNGHKKVD